MQAVAPARETSTDGSPDSPSQSGFALVPGDEMSSIVRALAGRLQARLPAGCGIELADLIQAGNVGLLKASRTFSFSRGVQFPGYAKFRIRGEMLDLVRRNAERDGAGVVSMVSTVNGRDWESQCAASPACSPQECVCHRERNRIIWEEIQRLPSRYRKVLRLRYTSEMTLREIGEALSVNESRACQLHQSALARLKTALRARGVMDSSQL
jgi:RNA polymerase sigma factor for flagellar operon FliA